MARTKRNAMLIEEARNKIRTTQLVNRLTNHALGKVDMSDSQVRATLGLLKKVIPDLAATQVTHDVTDSMADLLRDIDGQTRGLPGEMNGHAHSAEKPTIQ